MASNAAIRAPAITPDARRQDHIATAAAASSAVARRSVSFGFASLKTPANASKSTTAAAAAGNSNGNYDNNEGSEEETAAEAAATLLRHQAQKQYSLYRSAPDQFPSYERLRFVRLPTEWLPAGLLQQHQLDNEDPTGIQQENLQKLHYWPALIYQNVAELVADLSPAESQMLKAKLILEHRKRPGVVARLLGWKQQNEDGDTNSSNGERTNSKGERIVFDEPKLELIRLSGSSIEDNERSEGYCELLNFVDCQLDLEAACEAVLIDTRQRLDHVKAQDSGEEDRKEEAVTRGVVRHALQFHNAVDMALNCLALDVGSDPLPPREEVDYSNINNNAGGGSNNNMALLKTPAGERNKNVYSVEKTERSATDGGLIDSAAAVATSKADVSKEKIKTRKKENAKQRKGVEKNKTQGSKKRSQSSKSKAKLEALIASGEKENRRKSDPVMKSGLIEPKLKASKQAGAQAGGDKKTKKVKKSSRPLEARVHTDPAPKATADRVRNDKPTSKKSSSDKPPAFDIYKDQEQEEEAPKEEEMAPATSWKDVWQAMKRHGWTWRGGSGLMTDYYYIKPGRKLKDGVANQDYFVCVEDVQVFARSIYGWETFAQSEEELMANIKECCEKYANEEVPTLKESVEPHESWREVWQKMQRSGWTWKAGAGLMMDYRYVKPGCGIKTGVEGKDYFVRLEDVQRFARRNYGWRGEKEEGGSADNDGEKDGAMKAMGERRRSAPARFRGEDEVQEKRQKVERTKPVQDASPKPAEDLELEEPIEDAYDLCSEDDQEDGDSISDSRSTYSQSGFQSKKLFLEECADTNVPPLQHTIDPDEPWKDVWGKMRKSGWTWKMGSGLMTDYYYIKPGCQVKGGVKGEDYFEREEDVRAFARRNYGWGVRRAGLAAVGGRSSVGGGDRKRSSSAVGKKVAAQEQSKRQRIVDKEENLQQLQGAHKSVDAKSSSKATTSSSHSSSSTMNVPHNKKANWQELQKDGWRAISAGRFNKLHDWYYVRPGCDPGDKTSKLGSDYFLTEYDAIEWANRPPKTLEDSTDKQSANPKKQSEARRNKIVSSKDGDLLHTPEVRTKPQDPGIPLLSSPDKSHSSSTLGEEDDDFYEWKNLWTTLQNAGWNCIKAGKFNPLHDWYYVRPNRNPGDEKCKLGKHYFTCPDDVINFVRSLDKKDDAGHKGRKKSRESIGIILQAFEEEASRIG